MSIDILEHEKQEVLRANEAHKQPVVFVHGLWLLPSSWDRWAQIFEEAGYVALTPGWPDEPEPADETKTIAQVADHYERIVMGLRVRPAVIGHSFGGLLAEILAGRGVCVVTVAVAPAPFRGVLPLPISALKSVWPVDNPANRERAVPLTYDQFRFAFANMTSEDEARQLYDAFCVPAGGVPLFQAATASLNPWTEDRIREHPERGPLLIVAAEKDNTVPWSVAHASFMMEKQHNNAVTEIVQLPNRGHSITVDSGWREPAEIALEFVRRFASPDLNMEEAG